MLMANQDGLKMQVLRDLQRREGGQIIGDKLFPSVITSMRSPRRMCTTSCSVGSWYVLRLTRVKATSLFDRCRGWLRAYQPIVISYQVVRHRKRRDRAIDVRECISSSNAN
jgi:hypothetical protein